MPRDDETYTTAERADYEFPPCPECGGRTIGQWVNVSDVGSAQEKWIPGTYRCANPSRH